MGQIEVISITEDFRLIVTAKEWRRQKSTSKNDPAERAVRDIRRKTRKQYSAEEKIRIVPDGLRGEASIAELCRREGDRREPLLQLV